MLILTLLLYVLAIKCGSWFCLLRMFEQESKNLNVWIFWCLFHYSHTYILGRRFITAQSNYHFLHFRYEFRIFW